MEIPPEATKCAQCGWVINKREQAFWVTFALIALALTGIVAFDGLLELARSVKGAGLADACIHRTYPCA